MDSAVWMMQAVIDQRRREREADAAAHRRMRERFSGEASGRGSALSRWLRRPDPVPAVAVAEPERAGDDLELVGVGQPR
jgi:hypothetical protein